MRLGVSITFRSMKKYIILSLNEQKTKEAKGVPVFDKAVMMATNRQDVVTAFAKCENILDIYTLANA